MLVVSISSDMENEVRKESHNSGKNIKTIIHDALSSYFNQSTKNSSTDTLKNWNDLFHSIDKNPHCSDGSPYSREDLHRA